MNFFDRQRIFEALLKTSNEAENENEKTKKNVENDDDDNHRNDNDENIVFDFNVDDEFEVDIIALKNYSFVTINVNDIIFEMHELMQLIIKK